MTPSKYPYYLTNYKSRMGWRVMEMAIGPCERARKVGYFEFKGEHINLN